jgi:hypothetical protein
VDRQPRQPALGFEGHAIGALNPLERATDRVRLRAEDLELRPLLEVELRVLRPSHPHVHQAAEVIRPRVAAAALDRRR